MKKAERLSDEQELDFAAGSMPAAIPADDAPDGDGEPADKIVDGVHQYNREESWVRPEDPLLRQRLDWWQDQKLGLMMHWGPYSQLGLVESWALSDEDAAWSRQGVDWPVDGETFKKQYFNLNRTFNPIRFQPEQWAELAAEAGFRYLIFTTKHHDGFCMWDTRLSDYRVTAPDCPFHDHPRADICKHLFEAFRQKGLAIGAYFSKADWHSPAYWAPGMPRGAATGRGPSYDPQEQPALWEEFVRFTQGQIMELMEHYGRIDILWLDAGWVSAANGQDIRLGEAVDRARRFQPWLIAADRTVGGPYENYVTPEQTVPEKPLMIPWESCITLGTSFSFKYEDQYKSARQVIHMLIDVVAKGGNLALNVGPQPDGRLPEGAVRTLRELGVWLKANGEAIYGTRPCAPYRQGPFAWTRKGSSRYVFYLPDHENETAPSEILIPEISGEATRPVCRITRVETGEPWEFSSETGLLRIKLPAGEADCPMPPAYVFCLESS